MNFNIDFEKMNTLNNMSIAEQHSLNNSDRSKIYGQVLMPLNNDVGLILGEYICRVLSNEENTLKNIIVVSKSSIKKYCEQFDKSIEKYENLQSFCFYKNICESNTGIYENKNFIVCNYSNYIEIGNDLKMVDKLIFADFGKTSDKNKRSVYNSLANKEILFNYSWFFDNYPINCKNTPKFDTVFDLIFDKYKPKVKYYSYCQTSSYHLITSKRAGLKYSSDFMFEFNSNTFLKKFIRESYNLSYSKYLGLYSCHICKSIEQIVNKTYCCSTFICVDCNNRLKKIDSNNKCVVCSFEGKLLYENHDDYISCLKKMIEDSRIYKKILVVFNIDTKKSGYDATRYYKFLYQAFDINECSTLDNIDNTKKYYLLNMNKFTKAFSKDIKLPQVDLIMFIHAGITNQMSSRIYDFLETLNIREYDVFRANIV